MSKYETENRRLRAELQTMQKMCGKRLEERDAALKAEHQAVIRAAAFESDRDKIQRQFKVRGRGREGEGEGEREGDGGRGRERRCIEG